MICRRYCTRNTWSRRESSISAFKLRRPRLTASVSPAVDLRYTKTSCVQLACGRVRATERQPERAAELELELEKLRVTRAQLVSTIETLESACFNANTMAAMKESVCTSRLRQGVVHRLRRGDWRVLIPRSMQHRKERGHKK